MTESFDAIVIGTGQSGPSLAVRLAKAGMRTAIIERKLFGGTCVNVGCIPTKTLIASARAAYVARRGRDFGVVIDGPIGIDMKRVKARKDAIVARSQQGVTNWLKNTPNLTVSGAMAASRARARSRQRRAARSPGDLHQRRARAACPTCRGSTTCVT